MRARFSPLEVEPPTLADLQHDLPLNKKPMADPPGSQEDKREEVIFPLSAEYQLPPNYPEFGGPYNPSHFPSTDRQMPHADTEETLRSWSLSGAFSKHIRFPFYPFEKPAALDVKEVQSHSQESLVETAEAQIDIGDYPVLKSQTESNQKSTGLDENEVHHSESLIETAEGQIDIGDYPVLDSQTASNSAAGATFGFQFPEKVSAIITNKEMELRVYLNEGFQDADCLFEGGYDILPPGCSLVFKEQDTLTQSTFPFSCCQEADHLADNREMLWVLYNSQVPVDASSLGLLKNQSSLIKSIGDNIFSLVGLVDLRANSVLVYDAAMKDSDYGNMSKNFNLTI
jgi:hypothetical protein